MKQSKSLAKALLKPWVTPLRLMLSALGFRLLRITLDCTRIGHLIAETDCLMKEVSLGRIKQKKWIILYEKAKISNPAYLDLLPACFIPIGLGRNFHRMRRWLSKIIPATEVDHYVLAMHRTADMYKINAAWGDRGPTLQCPPAWIAHKNDLLARHGIAVDQLYVCIHARESDYSPADESYHHHRNVEITTYWAAVDYLLAQGYGVVRMGDPSMRSLDPSLSGVFDYARSPAREPWLDLAISAECTFFIGSSSGASFMATVFGRPVVAVGMALPFNFSPSGLPCDIGIPKLLRKKSSGHALNIREIFAHGLSELRSAAEIDEKGYALVENTSDEILAVVQEMTERLSSRWQVTQDDASRQSAMQSCLGPGSYSHGTASRCGASFLRDHRGLLVVDKRAAEAL